jgi:hypothetical protein
MTTLQLDPPLSPVTLEKHAGSEADSLEAEAMTVNPALERVVWRKMDLWILPIVAMFYLLSFLVRIVMF